MAADDLLCFALYRASRATTQLYRRLLAPWGLTYPQYLVLVELWARGAATVSELAACLDLDSGTLSPLLSRMERDDLVERSRDDADGRVVTVRPTARGAELQGELAGVAEELLRCSGVPIEQAIALRDGIRAFADGATAAR